MGVANRASRGARIVAALAGALAITIAGCDGAEIDAGAGATAAVAAASLEAGPNLLLITLDTLRADHLGAYGYAAIETPHIDRLAAEGVRFDQVATTVPITLPAHATIMTGLIPPRHGVRNNGNFRLEESVLTLAEVLRAEGYETAAFVASFVLDGRFGLAQGFARYTRFTEQEAEVVATPFLKIQRRAEEVVAEARDWLAARQGPFFAWVHLYDPHTPYDPPEPFASRYPGRPYDGEIAYTDDAVGKLRAALEASGHGTDTLVVLTADHGEGLGDHGETWHAFFVYDTTIRVPLVLWAPGSLPVGRLVAAQAGLVDLLPTSLALLGIDDPEAARRDGVDLRPLIAAPEAAGGVAYFESLVPLLNFGWSELRGLRRDGWKYIEAPRPELYRLTDDPGERNNLFDRERRRADEMAAVLDELGGNDATTTLASGLEPVDPDTLERLQSLGYLAAAGSPRPQRQIDPKDRIEVYEAFNDGLDAVIEMVVAERWDAAESALAGLDRVAPDHFIVHFYRGKVAAAQGRIDAAVAQLQRSLALSPAYSLNWIELARAHEARGEVDRAVALLEEAIATYPDVFSFPLQLGDLLLRHQRLDAALAAYRAAHRLLPRQPRLLAVMAALYLQQEAPIAAAEVLETLVAVTPDDARAWGNLGMVLGGLGRLDEADTAFRRALELDPGQAPFHYNLGLLLARQGRVEEARRALLRALEIDPGFEAARSLLARLR